MIINNNHGEVLKSSADMQTSAAKINMTPEMLHLLSSGIYKYKIRAVIRELSTNAVDAHIMKGIADRPIKVVLPNVFTQDLVIRDYGFGLTHDQVMENYLTYGFSTKNSSNDYIGAMGIGCKSPFAYCDAYTVESIQNSKKSIYTIYKENGIPQVTCLVSEMESDEEDGLCIRVPIKSEDIRETVKEASYVFETFNIYPDVEGEDIKREHYHNCIIEKPHYRLTRGTDYNRLYAVMGQIRYPLSQADYKVATVLERLLSQGAALWINFDIGDVSMAASREELQMTDDTRKKVQSVIDDVTKSLLSEMQASLDSCQTLTEMLNTYSTSVQVNLTDRWTRLHNAAHQSYKTLLRWKDKSVDEWIEYLLRDIHRQQIDDNGQPMVEQKTQRKTVYNSILQQHVEQDVTVDVPVMMCEFDFQYYDRAALQVKRKKSRSSSQLSMHHFSVLNGKEWYKEFMVFVEDVTARAVRLRDLMIDKYQPRTLIVFHKDNADQIDRFFDVTEVPQEFRVVHKFSDNRELVAVDKKKRVTLKNILIAHEEALLHCDCTVDELDELEMLPVMFITADGIVGEDGKTIHEVSSLTNAQNWARNMSALFNQKVYVIRYHSAEWKKVSTPIVAYGSDEFFHKVMNKGRLYREWNEQDSRDITIRSLQQIHYNYSEMRDSEVFGDLMTAIGLGRFYSFFLRYKSDAGSAYSRKVRDVYSHMKPKRKYSIADKSRTAYNKVGYLTAMINGCYRLDSRNINKAVERCMDFAGFADQLKKILKN
jgi:hypothetical protein